MTPGLERLLGWALTLFNFSVTAIVAWALALLIAANSVQPQVAQVQPLAPMGAFHSSLGFVGLPSAYLSADSLPPVAGSAVATPQDGGTTFRTH